ncbi:MAG: alpha-ribazole phosphatase [Rhodocyclaceae bacterium]|nr:alpha-ribazole phosphatase [Rhodocyclaceae bacterium]
MQVYLIRHPRPQVAAGVCYGRTDVPLAEDAQAAAARLRPLLPEEFVLYASPLQRAWRLACALGEPVADARLQEMDFGDWEMRHYDEIGAAAWAQWEADPLHFCPPGGESLAQLTARVMAWWQQVQASGAESVVVVAHGGPLRAWLGTQLKIVSKYWLSLDFACGACSRVDVYEWGVSLRWMNR